jgi:hypothetical protein
MMTETAQQSSRRLADETAERLLLIIEDDDVERAVKIRAVAECKQASVLAAGSRDCVDAMEAGRQARIPPPRALGALGALVAQDDGCYTVVSLEHPMHVRSDLPALCRLNQERARGDRERHVCAARPERAGA